MVVAGAGRRWAVIPAPQACYISRSLVSGKRKPALSHTFLLSLDVSEGNGQGNHIRRSNQNQVLFSSVRKGGHP